MIKVAGKEKVHGTLEYSPKNVIDQLTNQLTDKSTSLT